MRLQAVRHVEHEGPGTIAAWATERGHELAVVSPPDGEAVPRPETFDWLVVMGGPMAVYDRAEHQWIEDELDAIRAALATDRTVLGVCLGAQLLAAAAGAPVSPASTPEHGWHPVEATPAAAETPGFRALPDRYTPFHWHGDTFELPAGATRTAGGPGCRNQGFVVGERGVGLQFHLETTPSLVRALLDADGVPDHDGFCQGREALLDEPRCRTLAGHCRAFLDDLAGPADGT